MKNQPVIYIPKNRFESFLDVIGVLVFGAVLIYLLSQYGSMPNRVPGQYDARGEVIRWGSKVELLILPAVGISIWVLMTVLEKYPHVYNYFNLTVNNAAAQYKNGRLMVNVLKNESIIFFSYVIWQNIRVAKGDAESLSTAFFPILLVVISGTVLFFFIKMLRMK